ncbi:MAG: precorrin-3B synthase [Xanthobacteraceae bacterium]
MNAPLRRGACPGLSAPMPTGDGLLVRMRPVGTMTLAAFARLCAAARAHGNGVIEITARGSIQVRGLRAASAADFATEIAALDIAAADGVAVLTNPLAGLDPDELIDAGALAATLRNALAEGALAARLSPKVSVIVDGGGAPGLATLAADVRLRAKLINNRAALRVCVGGDESNAPQLGCVAQENGVRTAIRLLEFLARRGRPLRARDILAGEGVRPFSATIADLLLAGEQDVDGRNIGERSDAVLRTAMPGHDAHLIGLHRLRDGSFACGIGLAFGHADAAMLERLAAAAHEAGAVGFRAAPGRALLTIGLLPAIACAFTLAAEKLGFIVRSDDPRRHVIACAGAPYCASAYISARAIAPRIAEIAGAHRAAPLKVHVSGCSKGCAHPAPAALTIVGTPEGCALIVDGSTRDAPFATVSPQDLPAAIARHAEFGHAEFGQAEFGHAEFGHV